MSIENYYVFSARSAIGYTHATILQVYVDVKNWANNTVRLIKTPRVLEVMCHFRLCTALAS